MPVEYEYEYEKFRKRLDGTYEKKCSRCKEFKAGSEFDGQKRNLDGYTSDCKTCRRAYTKKYMDNNKEYMKKIYKEQNLKKHYGITLKQFNEMITEQKGCCYLCDETLPDNPKQIHVEHNHDTKQVYGIACHHCNLGISYFNHDPYKMIKVAKRMLRHRVVENPLLNSKSKES